MDHGQVTLLQPRNRQQRKHYSLAPDLSCHPSVVGRHRSRLINSNDDRPLPLWLVTDQVVLHQAAFGKSEIEEVFEVGIGQQCDLARQQTLNLRASGDRSDLIRRVLDASLLLLKRDSREAPADGGDLLQFLRMAYLLGYDELLFCRERISPARAVL